MRRMSWGRPALTRARRNAEPGRRGRAVTVGAVFAASTVSSRFAGLSPNSLGALYMIVGSVGYVTNDALVRAATEEGLDVYQALCLRGLAMTVIFAAITRRRGGRITRQQFTRPLVGRVAAELAGTALFFAALVNLDFANAQTILLLVPFAVTLTAALALGEPVTGRQYATVLAGFAGVLLVVQPATDGFSLWSLVVVASAAFMTVREFATRRVHKAIPAASVALITAVGLTILTGVISVFTGWNTVTPRAALLVGALPLHDAARRRRLGLPLLRRDPRRAHTHRMCSDRHQRHLRHSP